MKHITRRVIALSLLLFSSLTAFAAQRPKLLLALMVDQFRYDYLTKYRSDYHAGLKRLLEEGAVFTEARYRHFPTVTAIGHSTFLSGALPSVSGIVGNEWYDRADRRMVTSVSDDSTALVGGAAGALGSSPRRLLVSTLGDELKIAGKASKIISISVKDRSAILPVGHMADAAYWFDADTNRFVTSTYYMKALPEWVATVNSSHPFSQYLGAVWMGLDAKPGDKPFCSLVAGADVPFCGSVEATPYGNELLEDFAERAIRNEKLGTHEQMDVLALSLSANDYAGHTWGPDSPAVRDLSIRTDRLIGKLLDYIDAQVGKGNTLVVMSADHGVAPLPEVNIARSMPGGRLDSAQIARTIGKVLSSQFGPGNWFAAETGGTMYLDLETVNKNKADAAAVRRVAAEAARWLPHISRVFTSDQLERGEAAPDPAGRAIAMSYYGARCGDLVLIQDPYYLFSASGTSHSTPYSYDAHVPVILYGPGIRPGIYRNAAAVNDIAPTLAALLDVETPSGSSGRVLTEALQ